MDHYYPKATAVYLSIPVEFFFSEDETIDYDRLERAKAYAIHELTPIFPNAALTAFAYDSTSPHGTRVEGLEGDQEIRAYEILRWIELDVEDTE